MNKILLFFAAPIFASSMAIASGDAAYTGKTCVSCHEKGGGKSQAPIVNGTRSLSSTNERM